MARAARRAMANFTAPSVSWGFADFPAKLGDTRTSTCGAERQATFRRFFSPCWRGASKRVSAEFCAKQGSEFCTPMAKNRIRDNTSLSAPNDAGADHDRRGSRVRRLAKELTILRATRRASSRLCTSRRESVFCEAHGGRGSRPREPRGSPACQRDCEGRVRASGRSECRMTPLVRREQ